MPFATADDGAALYWTADGPDDAPALLFTNSIGCTSDMWAPQVQALTPQFRVIRHDARGHGRSDAPVGDYSLARLAADLAAILDVAGRTTSHLCGLSLGGASAQQFALAYPQRLERLVLANTASRIGSVDSWTQRIAAVREGGMEAIAETAIGRFFGPEFRAAHPQVVAPVLQQLLSTPAHGYVGACAALRDADLTHEVARIAAPTLVIGGEGDVSTPPPMTAALAQAIPGARHVVLAAAHLSNLERPEEFSAAVRGFLT